MPSTAIHTASGSLRLGASALSAGNRAGNRTTLRAAGSRRPLSATCAAKPYKICILPGDGIGPEIMDVGVKVLQAVGTLENLEFDLTERHIGGAAIDATGDPLPQATLDTALASDSVLLSAIGGYKWDALPAAQRPEKGLLRIRAALEVFCNLRPAVVLPQLVDASTLKREVVEGVDIMVVRELVGGIYFGEPRGFGERDGARTGFSTNVYSVPEIERIARVGFETAKKRSGKMCSVDKANVLEVSMLWREVVTKMGEEEYPEVELSHMYVDNAAMQLIRNPKYFDTILTENMFGDILSDEASMLTGSIGMLPSASVGAGGPGLFEPIHGSAPDIAGEDKANPLAQILSVAMMLRYGLNEEAAAARIEAAVSATLDSGARTVDLAMGDEKSIGCKEMGNIVLSHLQ